MKALKIQYFESPDEIIKKAHKQYGKHKGVAFAQFPDGSVRIILNGTCGDPEDFNGS